MGLVSIGPVTVSHGDPQFGASATPLSHGIESFSIAGSCSWAAAHTLRELVKNPDARSTVGSRTGVLEWLEFDDALLEPFTGYYLLEAFSISAAQKDSLTTADVPFTLSCAFLGDLA